VRKWRRERGEGRMAVDRTHRREERGRKEGPRGGCTSEGGRGSKRGNLNVSSTEKIFGNVGPEPQVKKNQKY
jgi:hypothetical protein